MAEKIPGLALPILLLFLSLLIAGVAAQTQCPSSCTCLLPVTAAERGYTAYCGNYPTVCGYDRLQNPLYCYRVPVTTVPPAPCPADCDCLTEAEAKAAGNTLFCGGKETVCGQVQTATAVIPKYCYEKPTAVTPTPTQCPSTCVCITPGTAKDKDYASCGDRLTVCDYDQSKNPLYCYQLPVTTTVPVPCPATCSCLLADTAVQQGSTGYCDGMPKLCGYDALQRPLFCYQLPVTTTAPPACPGTCACLSAAAAKEKGYSTFCDNAQKTCGYDQTGTPLYCYQLPVTTTAPPACPGTCACLLPAAAREKGYSTFCDNIEKVCGYDQSQNPLYCYQPPVTTTAVTCPQGCECRSIAGTAGIGYRFCGGQWTVCGSDPGGSPRYCVQRVAACPQGCSCLAESAKQQGYSLCGAQSTVCGVDSAKNTLYCHSPPLTPPTTAGAGAPESVQPVGDLMAGTLVTLLGAGAAISFLSARRRG